ncbi:hypothetical protein DRB87_17220 [Pandoraea sp. XY-2]|nr:hypothetical protein DRB87_17220 [Pandoraea sp. XY-2]
MPFAIETGEIGIETAQHLIRVGRLLVDGKTDTRVRFMTIASNTTTALDPHGGLASERHHLRTMTRA